MNEKAKENLTAAIKKLEKIFTGLRISKSTSAIIKDIEDDGYIKDSDDVLSSPENGQKYAEEIVRQYISDRVIAELTKNSGSHKNLMDALKNLTSCLGIADFNIRTLKIDYKEKGLLEQFTNLFSLSKNVDPKETIFKEQIFPEIHVFLENTAQKLEEPLSSATETNLGGEISTAVGHSFILNIIKVNPKLADFKSTIAPLAGVSDPNTLAAEINNVVAEINDFINSLSAGINALYEAAGELETIQQDTFSRGRIFQNNSLPDIYDYLQQNIQHLGTPLLPNIKAKSGLNLARESDNILITRVADADIAEAAAEPLKSLEVAGNDLQKWVAGINALAAAINDKIIHLSDGFKDLYKEFDNLKAAIPEPIKKASENEIEGVFDAFKSGTSQSLDGLVGLIEKFYAGD
jgi:hypothetical protein